MLWPMLIARSLPPRGDVIVLVVSLLSLAIVGCSGDVGEVQFDLCPGRNATENDRAILRSATSWQLSVFGLHGSNVIWQEDYSGTTVESLSLNASIPPEEDVRLAVEGRSAGQLVAMASSGVLSLRTGVRVCLCTAQPERYEELCPHWECSVNAVSRACWQ